MVEDVRRALLAGHCSVPAVGSVAAGRAADLPFVVMDADGREVESVSAYLRDLALGDASELPASGGERRMLLAANIAGGTSVSLNDTLPGIDRRNASLVLTAIAHATGGHAITYPDGRSLLLCLNTKGLAL